MRREPPRLEGTDPMSQSRRTKVRAALWSLNEDLRLGLHDAWVNGLGGHHCTPRVLRYLIYKASPHDVGTPLVRPGVTIVGRKLSIGAGCEIAPGCYFEANEQITVGASTTIGIQVIVLTSTHPLTEDGGFQRQATLLPVTIGERCFLGSRVIVCPGVSIADGVIVGAGSVITKDLTEPGLYAGSPARLIRPAAPTDSASRPEGT